MSLFLKSWVISLGLIAHFAHASIITRFFSHCFKAFHDITVTENSAQYVRTEVPGIPDKELAIFRTIPFGKKVRLTFDGAKEEGFIVDLRFRNILLWYVDGSTKNIPLSKIEAVESMPEEIPYEARKIIESNNDGYQRRLDYLNFLELSKKTWRDLKENFLLELRKFRMLSGREKEEYLKTLSNELDEIFSQKFPIKYGLHRNMHGGTGYEYVDNLGILATPGDNMILSLGASLPIPVDLKNQMPLTVYYYDSKQSSFADSVIAPDPVIPSQTFDGHYLIVFDVDKVKKSGKVEPYPSYNGRAFVVEAPKNSDRNNVIGVPIETFLLPPLRIMTDITHELGTTESFTTMEVKLATLRHLIELLKRYKK